MAGQLRIQAETEDGDPGGDPGDDAGVITRLVGRARAGDERALAAIVDRCTPMVRSVARRYLRRPSDVDDVAQEVWLTFTRHLHRIESPAATRGWLVRVTTHAAWRAQRKSPGADLVADVEDRAGQDDTEELGLRRAARAEAGAAVRAALAGLAPRERRLIELLVADDRPDYRTVATLVGRPVGSIGPTRQRILARLRAEPALAGLAPAS
jgi:RNA polymerase sigma factor (sigma-70 family)